MAPPSDSPGTLAFCHSMRALFHSSHHVRALELRGCFDALCCRALRHSSASCALLMPSSFVGMCVDHRLARAAPEAPVCEQGSDFPWSNGQASPTCDIGGLEGQSGSLATSAARMCCPRIGWRCGDMRVRRIANQRPSRRALMGCVQDFRAQLPNSATVHCVASVFAIPVDRPGQRASQTPAFAANPWQWQTRIART